MLYLLITVAVFVVIIGYFVGRLIIDFQYFSDVQLRMSERVEIAVDSLNGEIKSLRDDYEVVLTPEVKSSVSPESSSKSQFKVF